MTTNYQFLPLDKSEFQPLFNLSDDALAKQKARWVTADADRGFPCRVSLQNAKTGERVLALSYCFQEVDSPYCASGPIFVREHAEVATPAVNEIPAMLANSILSIRCYDLANTIIAADVVEGIQLEAAISHQFSNRLVDYLHIHFAMHGCFCCSVHRA